MYKLIVIVLYLVCNISQYELLVLSVCSGGKSTTGESNDASSDLPAEYLRSSLAQEPQVTIGNFEWVTIVL